MADLNYDLYGYDGDPNGVLDAPIGSLVRDLSSPVIWQKTTGGGIKTGWVSFSASSLSGISAAEMVPVSDQPITAGHHGMTVYIDNAPDESYSLELGNVSSVTVVDIIYGTAFDETFNLRFNAEAGATITVLGETGENYATADAPQTITRCVSDAEGNWTILTNATVGPAV